MHPLQNGSQVQNMPPLKPLVGTAGYFSESNEQGAPSWPGQDYFNKQIAEFLNALAAAGLTYNPARTDHLARMISGSNFAWLSMPIGSPLPLIGDLPPTDSDAFRYVVLTDADPYNDGVLINKEVSGTAPNLVIKYTIDMPDSPLHGTKIEMLNTMEAVVSPSITNGKVFNDTIRNMTGSAQLVGNNSTEGILITGTGVIGVGPLTQSSTGFSSTTTPNVRSSQFSFDASRQVPTGNRNQPFAVGAKYLMRIK
ncbi:hypothetical protein [Vibrio metoecus]|uniref:hypothetical protein n=1 Tax=Vibrio metoecus TaxID=1481663 RepID=UPI00215CFD8D|nr:hypothetical protein [Vibrio metoecus]MCR9387706.1 hypothetical protein [Vibrio metoecus]